MLSICVSAGFARDNNSMLLGHINTHCSVHLFPKNWHGHRI